MTKNLKYTKGAWYHVDSDDKLTPIDYEKEIHKYYQHWHKYLKAIAVNKDDDR
jgi:hypothetical protein